MRTVENENKANSSETINYNIGSTKLEMKAFNEKFQNLGKPDKAARSLTKNYTENKSNKSAFNSIDDSTVKLKLSSNKFGGTELSFIEDD